LYSILTNAVNATMQNYFKMWSQSFDVTVNLSNTSKKV